MATFWGLRRTKSKRPFVAFLSSHCIELKSLWHDMRGSTAGEGGGAIPQCLFCLLGRRSVMLMMIPTTIWQFCHDFSVRKKKCVGFPPPPPCIGTLHRSGWYYIRSFFRKELWKGAKKDLASKPSAPPARPTQKNASLPNKRRSAFLWLTKKEKFSPIMKGGGG